MGSIDWPGWVWGTLAFVGLQLLAFAMGVIGNLSTPLVKSQFAAMHKGWSNWRAFRLAAKLYKVRRYSQAPSIALAHIIQNFGMAIILLVSTATLTIVSRIPNKVTIVEPLIDIPAQVDLYVTLVGLALSALMFTNAYNHFSILVYPRAIVNGLKKRATKLGVPWETLSESANQWLKGASREL
jgi:hypothetical protein